jgi:hypothetical protein
VGKLVHRTKAFGLKGSTALRMRVFPRGAGCDIVCAATCNSLSVFDGLSFF